MKFILQKELELPQSMPRTVQEKICVLGGEGAQNDKRQNYTDTQKEKIL